MLVPRQTNPAERVIAKWTV